MQCCVLRAAPGVAEGVGLGRRLAACVDCRQLAGLVQAVRLGQGAGEAPATHPSLALGRRLVAGVMPDGPITRNRPLAEKEGPLTAVLA